MSFIFKVFSLWLAFLFLIERPSLEFQIKKTGIFSDSLLFSTVHQILWIVKMVQKLREIWA